jgi:hypothetical protein
MVAISSQFCLVQPIGLQEFFAVSRADSARKLEFAILVDAANKAPMCLRAPAGWIYPPMTNEPCWYSLILILAPDRFESYFDPTRFPIKPSSDNSRILLRSWSIFSANDTEYQTAGGGGLSRAASFAFRSSIGKPRRSSPFNRSKSNA